MSRHPGILIALGAALLFGASTPLAKFALSSAHPLLVAGLLYLGSGIGLAVVRNIRSGKAVETPLSRDTFPGSPAPSSPGAWSDLDYYCWG